jgi:hypothetical protein
MQRDPAYADMFLKDPKTGEVWQDEWGGAGWGPNGTGCPGSTPAPPGSVLPKQNFSKYWDFRNETARKVYQEGLRAVAASPHVNGVFFDDVDIALCGGDCSGPGGCGGASCSCTGPAEDSAAAAQDMWAGWTQHWREVGQMLNAHGKLPVYSSIMKYKEFDWVSQRDGALLLCCSAALELVCCCAHAQASDSATALSSQRFIRNPVHLGGAEAPDQGCIRPEEDWIAAMHEGNVSYARYYEMQGTSPDLAGKVQPANCAKDILNMEREVREGLPVFVRAECGGNKHCNDSMPAGYSCGETCSSPQFSFAKFLVAAGPNTWLTLQCGGYDDDRTTWFDEFKMKVGAPLEPMQKGADGVSFSRRFANADVNVTCTAQHGSSSIVWKTDDETTGEKDAELAQKLGQLQPFTAVFPQECMGQLASSGPT